MTQKQIERIRELLKENKCLKKLVKDFSLKQQIAYNNVKDEVSKRILKKRLSKLNGETSLNR